MKKLLAILVLGLMWCNVSFGEIKQNYHCSGQTIAGNDSWNLTIKKRAGGNFYDVYNSYYTDENPFYAKFIKEANMLMWFLATEDGYLLVDFFEVHDTGNTHAAIMTSDFKSTAEFEDLHNSYTSMQKFKKSSKQIDRARLASSEVNFYSKAALIAERSMNKKSFMKIYNIKCKAS